jgi:hypothetical protein
MPVRVKRSTQAGTGFATSAFTMSLNLENRRMDPSILQAAQRVMAWHLQHTMVPVPPADPAEDDDSAPAGRDTDKPNPDRTLGLA